ncbi:MAG: amidophosphoribosyltransferase, partial [Bauldia sp.]
DFIKVDSLAFVSIDGLYRAVADARRDNDQPQFCDACFTGAYPTRLADRENGDTVRPLRLLAGAG